MAAPAREISASGPSPIHARCRDGHAVKIQDAKAFTKHISEAGKQRHWRQAASLFDDMLREGIKPDVVTFSALISTCEKGEDLPKALQLCKDFQHQGIKPDVVTYSALISTCEKGQDLPKAL